MKAGTLHVTVDTEIGDLVAWHELVERFIQLYGDEGLENHVKRLHNRMRTFLYPKTESAVEREQYSSVLDTEVDDEITLQRGINYGYQMAMGDAAISYSVMCALEEGIETRKYYSRICVALFQMREDIIREEVTHNLSDYRRRGWKLQEELGVWRERALTEVGKKRKVVIELDGGVAEVTDNPDGVEVQIVDHDMDNWA